LARIWRLLRSNIPITAVFAVTPAAPLIAGFLVLVHIDLLAADEGLVNLNRATI
jgi:hypothetical protein